MDQPGLAKTWFMLNHTSHVLEKKIELDAKLASVCALEHELGAANQSALGDRTLCFYPHPLINI